MLGTRRQFSRGFKLEVSRLLNDRGRREVAYFESVNVQERAVTDRSSKPRVLLFDVNETLLDLAALKRRVSNILIESGKAELWFATMLQHSLAMTVAGQYASFPDIGAAVLRMLARNSDIAMGQEDAKQVLSVMRELAPTPPAPRTPKIGSWRIRSTRSRWRLAWAGC